MLFDVLVLAHVAAQHHGGNTAGEVGTAETLGPATYLELKTLLFQISFYIYLQRL